jgi:site-specific DNA recombinase
MTPVHTAKASRRYRYYVSRLRPGEGTEAAWRLPAREIERIVLRSVASKLRAGSMVEARDAKEIAESVSTFGDLASRLDTLPVPEAREALLQLGVRVGLKEDAIQISMVTDHELSFEVPARVAHRGRELKLVLPADTNGALQEADPVLLRLVAHAKAAQDMVCSGTPHPEVAHYGKRHFWQLLRISWLAPDIINAIVEGRQPPELTGRRLLRATSIPLDWPSQRQFFGFP